MGYMKDKTSKQILTKKKKVRGINIIKNKECILKL